MPYRGGNYSYVIDSSFQPFSMQEMLIPFTAYKDAFEQSETAYNDLKSKADEFKYLSTTLPEGSKAREIYEGYANDLNKQAEDFSNNGLNMENRSGLTSLKQRYSGEIGRLVKADALRKQQIEEQRKLYLQDPTRMFSRDAAASTIDAYLDNPDIGYKSYSGALLAQQVGTAASAIAKSLMDYGNGKPLDGYTRTWLQQHGYSPAAVAQAIQNPSADKTGILSSIVEQAVQSAGIPEWADPSTLQQAYAYARQGLWNAVGQTNISTYTDEAAKLAAQEASQKRIAAYVAGLQGTPTGFDPEFDTRNIRTDREVAADIKDKKMFDKYGEYFYRDPNTKVWKMTAEGMKKYKETPKVYRGPYSTAVNTSDTEFKEWIDARGLSEMAKGRTGTYQSDILSGMFNRVSNILDVHSAIEYVKGIGSENYEDVISALNRVSKEGEIDNYTRSKQGNDYLYAPADKKKVSELASTDIKSAQVIYGNHGDFLEVNLKDGDVILQPFQIISPTYESVVSGNRNMVNKYMEAKANGLEYIDDQLGRPIPIDDWINGELNSYGKNLSSALSRTKVEPRKVEPGYYGTR